MKYYFLLGFYIVFIINVFLLFRGMYFLKNKLNWYKEQILLFFNVLVWNNFSYLCWKVMEDIWEYLSSPIIDDWLISLTADLGEQLLEFLVWSFHFLIRTLPLFVPDKNKGEIKLNMKKKNLKSSLHDLFMIVSAQLRTTYSNKHFVISD